MNAFDTYVRPIGVGVLAAGLALLGGCADPAPDAPATPPAAEGAASTADTARPINGAGCTRQRSEPPCPTSRRRSRARR